MLPGERIAPEPLPGPENHGTVDYSTATQLAADDLNTASAGGGASRILHHKFSALDDSASGIGVRTGKDQAALADFSHRTTDASAASTVLDEAFKATVEVAATDRQITASQ